MRTLNGVIGDEGKLQAQPLLAIPGVEQVLPILKLFKLASRIPRLADTVVEVKGGGKTAASVSRLAGPDRGAMLSRARRSFDAEIARMVKKAGQHPSRRRSSRTSPYSL